MLKTESTNTIKSSGSSLNGQHIVNKYGLGRGPELIKYNIVIWSKIKQKHLFCLLAKCYDQLLTQLQVYNNHRKSSVKYKQRAVNQFIYTPCFRSRDVGLMLFQIPLCKTCVTKWVLSRPIYWYIIQNVQKSSTVV